MAITGAQIRAGRAFAKLSANELASRARVGRTTIARAEVIDGIPPTTVANLFAIKAVLEKAGVTFGADGSVNYHQPMVNS
jgi:hypothetical protein